MADDDLTAELDRIAERHEHMRARYGNVGGLLALAGAKDDMPRVLAALRAVLELADGWSDAIDCDPDLASLVREAITRKITGNGE